MAPFGFLLVDKPRETASFDVVRILRRILRMKRIGYAGTLDPLATGLMIVAAGEATKLLHDLEQTHKMYEVEIRLGAVSETFDAEGPVHAAEPGIAEAANGSGSQTPSREDIVAVIQENFIGERMQIPPRYSAVKIGGKHAYELVRKGKDVQLQAKKVVFYDIRILDFNYPVLRCAVHCSSGTYIRSLAHDLGQKLGCGGYVANLRRTKIGSFGIEDAIPLGEITADNFAEFLLSPEKFLSDWPQCKLSLPEYEFLGQGGFLPNGKNIGDGPCLAIFQERTVGLLELCEGGKSIKFAKKFNLG
jgi:tRNA pseudouridine55 synthase